MSGAANKRDEAYARYRAGRVREAIQLQVEVVNAGRDDPARGPDDLLRLALYAYAVPDHAGAARALEAARALAPDNVEVLGNLAAVYTRLGRHAEAVAILRPLLERAPTANGWDTLAHCYGALRRDAEMREAGARALALKMEAAADGPRWPVPDGPPPAFRFDEPDKHVISFSLWGRGEVYLEGARRNLAAWPHVYPGWSVRFHVDETVPEAFREELRAGGAELVMMPPRRSIEEGYLWRFAPVADPSLKRVLVRDVDSVLNTRERAAVDAWLASGRWFHVMRDAYTHTELILAGMWGAVAGVLPPVAEWRARFRSTIAPTRTRDQEILRQVVWPTVSRSVLVHDRFGRTPDAEPFPPFGDLPPWAHVGQGAPWRFGPRGVGAGAAAAEFSRRRPAPGPDAPAR